MDIQKQTDFLNHYGIKYTDNELSSNAKKTVVVGMSGGVDSSVTALICKMLGFKTLGIFMKNWEEIDAQGVCSAQEDYNDVISVCERLDIPYYSVNFSEEYKENVFAEFVEEYKLGHTPNPDILCNREIKFKVFLKKSLELGADFLATGHYCQNISNQLVKGVDNNKDQTYFLYTIQKDQLEKVIFPVGALEKSTVRKIAKDYNLSTFDKKDSTGICFIGERDFKKFLSQYINSQKGIFINLENGKEMGAHDGMCFYTIGQRKGMGIGGPGGPWFVAKKDLNQNIVYVVQGEEHPALYADYLYADELSWVDKEPEFPMRLKAKIRYRQKDQECTITKVNNRLQVNFDHPQRAISIRQSIVFYKDNLCLGGGIIVESGPTYFEQKKSLTNI